MVYEQCGVEWSLYFQGAPLKTFFLTKSECLHDAEDCVMQIAEHRCSLSKFKTPSIVLNLSTNMIGVNEYYSPRLFKMVQILAIFYSASLYPRERRRPSSIFSHKIQNRLGSFSFDWSKLATRNISKRSVHVRAVMHLHNHARFHSIIL